MRIAALAILLLMLLVYYAGGLAFQFWPDSAGYLVQAQGIVGHGPYSRVGDRNVGYAALVALALETPAPALALVAMQVALTAASFAALHLALTRVALPRLLPSLPPEGARGAISLCLALAALYSVVHVQIASLLTETLFTFLVLAAVLAVAWLLLPRRPSRPLREAGLVSALLALPLIVKPHWQLAAPALALVVCAWLVWHAVHSGAGGSVSPKKRAAALALVPLLVPALVVAPDRILSARHGARDAALFGPRTVFCNHAHLIHATLARRPQLELVADPAVRRELVAELDRLVAAHRSGWRLLGYNGDLCTYDAAFSAVLDRHFPDPGQQGRVLIGSVIRASLADPLPYARKVATQMVYGFTSAFSRFAVHGRTDPDSFAMAARTYGLSPGFLAGVRLAPEVGPLASKAVFDSTWPGRILQGLLATIFHVATVALAALALATLLLPPFLWRRWSGPVRRSFLALVALPLGAILAHHALIALVHSFDVWRYGFNMFYVNLLFMGTAAMFWLGDWRRRRHAR